MRLSQHRDCLDLKFHLLRAWCFSLAPRKLRSQSLVLLPLLLPLLLSFAPHFAPQLCSSLCSSVLLHALLLPLLLGSAPQLCSSALLLPLLLVLFRADPGPPGRWR